MLLLFHVLVIVLQYLCMRRVAPATTPATLASITRTSRTEALELRARIMIPMFFLMDRIVFKYMDVI